MRTVQRRHENFYAGMYDKRDYDHGQNRMPKKIRNGIMMKVKMYKYTPSSLGGYSQVYIKSPERSVQKITINGYLLVNAKNILGNEEHEERMSIKNKS